MTFSGINKCIIQLVDKSNTLQIDGFSNDNGENLFLADRLPIDFDNKDSHEIFICSIMNKFEEELRQWIKNNIKRMVPAFFKASYDFVGVWKFITSKVSIFQVICLMSNLAFFHDLSCILSMQNKNQLSLQQQLEFFVSNIEANLKVFIEALRSRMNQTYPKNALALQYQYVLLIQYHCDIVRKMIECRVSGIEEFEYLALPKFSFEFPASSLGSTEMFDATLRNYKKITEEAKENPTTVYTEIGSQSEIFKTIEGMQALKNFDIGLRCMNYRIGYGYEVLPATSDFVFTPFSQRCMVTLANAIATNVGGIIRGPNNIGKRSTVKALSHLVGKELFTFDCYGNNYEFVSQIFNGMTQGDFWVMFENVHIMQYGLLSTFCNTVTLLLVIQASNSIKFFFHNSL